MLQLGQQRVVVFVVLSVLVDIPCNRAGKGRSLSPALRSLKQNESSADVAAKQEACAIIDTTRIECGNLGINQHECLQKGCCYKSSKKAGVPFCYYAPDDAPPDKKTVMEQCTVHDHDKVDCGFQGVRADSCLSRGCCYVGSSVPGVPFCYYRKGKEPLSAVKEHKQCLVPDALRRDCGFSGVTKQQCLEKGCCYRHPLTPGSGAPFCYFGSSTAGKSHSIVPPTTTRPPGCRVPGPNRKDCGVKGITPTECISRGCCYYHTATIGAPFCFYKVVKQVGWTNPGVSLTLPQHVTLGTGKDTERKPFESTHQGWVIAGCALTTGAVLCLAFVMWFQRKGIAEKIKEADETKPETKPLAAGEDSRRSGSKGG
mmetsp:Transcript_102077/g.202648  ORF Transcript_102077/g.202648 Transcript_102077/m.202648 type:complete len:370 (+) Transcript_102077:52-1161(+)